MAKVKVQWVNTDYCSFQVEVPQTKRLFEREENKRVSHQVKRLNRNYQNFMSKQFSRSR